MMLVCLVIRLLLSIFGMAMETRTFYNDFPTFLKRFFPGKVQKISLNAGFTCPNRDGTVGYGGCTYCNNQTFNPEYCRTEKTVAVQLEEGKRFFAHKYPEMKYLAYFQAYTNTYGELEALKHKYEEALAVDDVVGLVIGTRPDCMPDALLDYLETLAKGTFVLVEYGIESTLDRTLRRINRGDGRRGAYGRPRAARRRTRHPGAAWRVARGHVGAGGGHLASATRHPEAAPVATDTRYPHGA